MKKLLTLLIALSSFWAYPQIIDSHGDGWIVLVANDGEGNTDTVKFGFDDKATVGIDTLLGEKDLYKEAYNDLDLRFIQRTETNISYRDTFWIWNDCTGRVKPFKNNLDTKTDLRRSQPYPDDHFILKVHGTNFPITIRAVKNYMEGPFFLPICIIRDSLTIQSPLFRPSELDTIVQINNSEELCLIHFTVWVFVSSQQLENTEFKLFPNPANHSISISHTVDKLENEVFNMKGTKLKSFTSLDGNYELDISAYPPGIYFIRNRLGSHKFVKTGGL